MQIAKNNPINEDNFLMKIQGNVFTDRKLAGEAIIDICKQIKNPDDKLEFEEYRGFPLAMSLDSGKFIVSLKNEVTHKAELENNISGNIVRINNALEFMPKDIARLTERLETLNNEMDSAKTESTRPFPKEQEYHDKNKRLAELNIELDNSQEENEIFNDKSDVVVGEKKSSLLGSLKQAKENIVGSEVAEKGKDLEVR